MAEHHGRGQDRAGAAHQRDHVALDVEARRLAQEGGAREGRERQREAEERGEDLPRRQALVAEGEGGEEAAAESDSE